MNDMKLELWRLASDLTVEDAAILIAGGDPSAVDYEEDSFNRQNEIKRTSGHPGFIPVFTALTNAIRKGHLSARLATRADGGGPLSNRLSGDIWILSHREITHIRSTLENDPFDSTPLDGADGIQIQVEPDWTRTTVDVENLKAWLRSRGFTNGFFFPLAEETSDSFMDPSHDHFAPELALAVSAWRALEGKSGFSRGSKAAISGWIEANPDAWRGEGDLSESAKERIVTVTNWRKTGGAPTTAG